ncbi:MAG: hypothetical protein OSB66_00515, partial [SAR202 cluster bacterium]|nr:hypothetical protein [SAR202 cluster bacterium]
ALSPALIFLDAFLYASLAALRSAAPSSTSSSSSSPTGSSSSLDQTVLVNEDNKEDEGANTDAST